MDSGLADIDRALFDTLTELLASEGHGGAFASLTRYAGKPASRDPQLDAQQNPTPAMMLALEKESFVLASGMDTIALRQMGWLGTSIWRVYVVHSELAGYDEAVTGQTDSPGILGLVDAVVRALSGLAFPGSYRNSRLIPMDATPEVIEPGRFIYTCRFQAQRYVDSVPITDDSVDLSEMDAGLHVASPTLDSDGNINGVAVADSPLVSIEITEE